MLVVKLILCPDHLLLQALCSKPFKKWMFLSFIFISGFYGVYSTNSLHIEKKNLNRHTVSSIVPYVNSFTTQLCTPVPCLQLSGSLLIGVLKVRRHHPRSRRGWKSYPLLSNCNTGLVQIFRDAKFYEFQCKSTRQYSI